MKIRTEFINLIPKWKLCLDRLLIATLSPLILLIAATIAVYIKVVSKGPIFFKQKRIGMNGKPFTCYKFRSMKEDGHELYHKQHVVSCIKNKSKSMNKMDDRDSRIIRGGKILRSSGLDELPQVINIWKGEMSLVGPRPCLQYEYDQYSQKEKQRLGVLPGITGLWQVSGKNELTFDEMIILDIKYSKNLSLLEDLKILSKTPIVIINQLQKKVSTKTNQS